LGHKQGLVPRVLVAVVATVSVQRCWQQCLLGGCLGFFLVGLGPSFWALGVLFELIVFIRFYKTMWVLGFVPIRWASLIDFFSIMEWVSDWADISLVHVCCLIVLLVL